MADFVNEKAFGPFLLTQVSIKQKAVAYSYWSSCTP
jgi:hypothetical protein